MKRRWSTKGVGLPAFRACMRRVTRWRPTPSKEHQPLKQTSLPSNFHLQLLVLALSGSSIRSLMSPMSHCCCSAWSHLRRDHGFQQVGRSRPPHTAADNKSQSAERRRPHQSPVGEGCSSPLGQVDRQQSRLLAAVSGQRSPPPHHLMGVLPYCRTYRSLEQTLIDIHCSFLVLASSWPTRLNTCSLDMMLN